MLKILNEISREIYEAIVSVVCSLYAIVFGSEDITPILSVKGVLNKYQFLAVVIALSIFNSWIKMLNSAIITYLFGLLLFYCFFAAIQKRCRDFGNKGTIFILSATIMMLAVYAIYMLEGPRVILSYAMGIVMFTILCILPLFFIPSKEEKDENLRSPLLKYPLVYAVISWMLAIGATWAMNSYAGVELNLF
ncbi:MAG: hypothetical protein IJ532_05425 [Alphaproteobacteria bacterium]|nr:hypothetical protein [Alphaproteobacteria bacterium]